MRYLFESPKKVVAPKPKNMASSITAKVLEIRKESIKNCLGDLNTMSHRQHYIDTIDGVSYYDDSQADNVNATWFTFENILNPVVWIVGGSCHTNYSELIETAKLKVKAIVSLGNEKENIELTFKGVVNEIHEASGIAEAVRIASIIAEENDLVLFSPACKDQEMNYSERGQAFIEEVKKLNN
jgi:UDP-N-acetylmuramoylalanine--D-glutamate ligase